MNEISRWDPGTQVVQHEMWGEGIATARPVTVVDDLPSHIVLYSHPNTQIVSRVIESRYSLNLSARIDLYIEMLDPNLGDLKNSTSSDKHVLTLTPINSLHSIWLFWTGDWIFENWYVNFQSPVRRMRHGIQIHDYALDIVVQPDMSWSWKDVDEFEELISRRFFTADHVSSIRAESDRMIRAIEENGTPFSDSWESWRPDPDWPIPTLPDDWDVVNS